ncbi:MAG: RDD family protein [Tunicatimonas sp.]
MQKISIQTTQNVRIDYVLAGIGDRILAYLIDLLIIVAYASALGLLFASLSLEPSLTIFILLALPAFMYHLLCEALLDGQSVGKRQMKIKVVKLDGSSPGLGAYVMRWILRLIDMNVFGGGIAVLCIAITTRDQRLGDLAAGTTVVKVKGQETTPVFATDDDYQPTFTEVTRLTDADIDTIQRVIKAHRDSGNTEPVLATALKVQQTLAVQSDMRPLQFLFTVVRDYKHLTAQ